MLHVQHNVLGCALPFFGRKSKSCFGLFIIQIVVYGESKYPSIYMISFGNGTAIETIIAQNIKQRTIIVYQKYW